MQAENLTSTAVVTYSELRMFAEIADEFIYALADLFTVRKIGFVGSVVVKQLCVVAALVMPFVLIAPFTPRRVERDKCFDEIAGFGVLGVFEKRDIRIVEEILVEDALAVEDGDDVSLVLEIGRSELL